MSLEILLARRTFINKKFFPFQFSVIVIEEVRVGEHHRRMVKGSAGVQAVLLAEPRMSSGGHWAATAGMEAGQGTRSDTHFDQNHTKAQEVLNLLRYQIKKCNRI